MRLRKYQLDLSEKVLESNSKDLVQLPTGGGKTIIAGFLSKTYLTEGKKVLFLAHREELLNQPIEKFFTQFGITSSIIKGKEVSDLFIPMQIASIQTFHKRLNFAPDVIIIDEAHHAEASTYQKIIKSFPVAKLIGLTATPYRLSGKGFNKTFDRLIASKNVKGLEEELFLVQGKTFGYPVRHEKLLRAKYLGNDYTEQVLEEIMNDRVLIEDIIVSYEKHTKGKKMIVFASSIKHSQAICQRFKEYGINALHIDAKTEDRSEIINEFRFGQTNILCNVGIATEGVDIPEIECVCLARPTMSLALYLQMVGRGSRPLGGKQHYTILDHSNNYIEHGAPNKEHDWLRYFNGMSKAELVGLKKGKQFKLISEDGTELIIDNILDIPLDIKGFVLEEVEVKEVVKRPNGKEYPQAFFNKYTSFIRSLSKFVKKENYRDYFLYTIKSLGEDLAFKIFKMPCNAQNRVIAKIVVDSFNEEMTDSSKEEIENQLSIYNTPKEEYNIYKYYTNIADLQYEKSVFLQMIDKEDNGSLYIPDICKKEEIEQYYYSLYRAQIMGLFVGLDEDAIFSMAFAPSRSYTRGELHILCVDKYDKLQKLFRRDYLLAMHLFNKFLKIHWVNSSSKNPTKIKLINSLFNSFLEETSITNDIKFCGEGVWGISNMINIDIIERICEKLNIPVENGCAYITSDLVKIESDKNKAIARKAINSKVFEEFVELNLGGDVSRLEAFFGSLNNMIKNIKR
jgi:superfamily II DNA or RNA helicase